MSRAARMLDVVVPVYRGLDATRRCLDSVLANPQRTPYELVVVDDATPEPEIAQMLDRLREQGRATLLRHAENRGFVHAANLGMALHPERDVVLLNSDAEVAGDWLDRLARAAQSAPDVGTVTPFSDNATICTYPYHGWSGGVPGALGLAGLDALFARVNAGRTAELPTGVGFCLYVRRDCLARIGPFSPERFGRGYGEENDFCQRALDAGFRNLLAADVFVHHEGAVSFGAEREARAADAEQRLAEIHPRYVERVQAFLRADPLAPLRDAIDDARLAHGDAEARHVVTERRAERASLLVRTLASEEARAHAEKVVRDYEADVARAAADLARASADIGLLQGRLEGHEKEIAALREGLARAESLAFAREAELRTLNAELARIRAFPLWKTYAYLLGRSGGR